METALQNSLASDVYERHDCSSDIVLKPNAELSRMQTGFVEDNGVLI